MRWILLLLLFLPIKASDFLAGSRTAPAGNSAIEQILEKEAQKYDVGEARGFIDDETTTRILSDVDKRVPDQFRVSPYFYPFVRFWFGIYTRYTSDQIVLHDKDNLGIVYSVLDFSRVGGTSINRFAKAAIVQNITKEKIAEFRKTLRELADGNASSRNSLSVLKTLQDSGFPPPTNLGDRRKYFLDRVENLRAQTGQRNQIENGIANMAPFAPFFSKLFQEFNLPPQLLAIPFLESSFNNSAHSKVGALGIWQFMPLISSYFMPKRNDHVDYRSNPLVSSVAALHLLKENKMILGEWDLAVTAYNSGTKHLVRAKREFGFHKLEDVLSKYDHPHLGFASKNFYAEFIALVYTLANRDEIFPDKKNIPTYDMKKLHLAISKCPFSLKGLQSTMKQDFEKFKELNPHLYSHRYNYPRGTIVVAAKPLGSKFYRLSFEQLVRSRPHKWQLQWLKNQSCSTK